MENLNELREKKRAYVKAKADFVIKYMLEKGETSFTWATCDHSNWDREMHEAMPDIARELQSRGLSYSAKVNWGVTDWLFTVNV